MHSLSITFVKKKSLVETDSFIAKIQTWKAFVSEDMYISSISELTFSNDSLLFL